MKSITGYVGVDEIYTNHYNNLSKLDKLKFDLMLLEMAGFTGPTNVTTGEHFETRNGIRQSRQWFIDDVKKMIKQEQRKLKLNNIETCG